jgi:MYXO-CTERM domain-containing protein
VALDGDTAIAGAPDHPVGEDLEAGAAYVFVRSGSTWTQQAELTASDQAAHDSFGWAVALRGATAIAGAPNHAPAGSAGAGAAYVFLQSGTAWTQQAELAAIDGTTDDHLGVSVALIGGTTIAGAFAHQTGGNTGAGAAYVFDSCGEGDAGTSGSTGSGTTGSGGDSSAGSNSSGCACATARNASPPIGLGALCALLGLALRRHRQRQHG